MANDKAIICVDDEQIILMSLLMQVKKNFGDRFQCESAQSADDAMEVINDLVEDGIKIVLIISDWLMPGERGDDFLIKVHKMFPNIKLILLTGQADQEAIERLEKEVDLFLCIHKPWNEKILVDAVNSALS